MRNSAIRWAIACLATGWLGCISNTGGELIEFGMVAEGDEASRFFVSPLGYEIHLEKARIHIGALYLNQSIPGNHTLETSCVLPGIYSAEVRSGLWVDALSAGRQVFPVRGNGTTEACKAAEIWLGEGDIDALENANIILEVTGEAARGGERWPFEGRLSIGQNRVEPPKNPALPGSNPICKQRIITPIPIEFQLKNRGLLVLKVVPSVWFANVEFSELGKAPGAARYAFKDEAAGQPDNALYAGMRANFGPYHFSFEAFLE
ncbi:MAG: hypothetical protein FWC28_03745 [Proteobacteria bacterium]|nr:hypothetical protein [Cystobacterineae bacterium]MCL2259404.1 hypothetical protein [Cystobacterineae bacterium]MCL2314352.1 hypothetical protein [Pseudomonadota bacterium]